MNTHGMGASDAAPSARRATNAHGPCPPLQSPATRQHTPGTRSRCAAIFCHVCAASSWLGPCAVPGG